MKYFSMFSGIGGFELGIQRAYETTKIKSKNSTDNKGGTSQYIRCPLCVGYSEIDRYAISIYKKHFNHKNYGNATELVSKDLPDFDFLVGGFPCQSFSIAGKRKGFHDTRGTLFFEIARVLRDKRPRYFLLENVKGLLSHNGGKTFQTILGVLAGLGYGVEWQVLNSKNFGVPQNRERVFFVGYPRGERRPKVFPIGESDGTDNRVITEIDTGHQGNSVYKSDGLATTLNANGGGQGGKTGLYAIGGLQKHQTNGIYNGTKIRRLTPTECERLQGFPDGWTEGVSDTQRYKTLGNAVTVNVIEAIITKFTKEK